SLRPPAGTRPPASLRVAGRAPSRPWRGEGAGFAEGGARAWGVKAGALTAAGTSMDRGTAGAGCGAAAVLLSSAKRTPQLGHWSASAGTDALHTGHSYSVAAPSENSAPHPGQTVASAATRV